MLLEGSRHEKVLITITAYVIGFTTAFIAFGQNQHYHKTKYYLPVTTATHETLETSSQTGQLDTTLHQPSTNVIESHEFVTEVGLYYRSQGDERIVSVNRSYLDNAPMQNGYHVAVHGVSLSPNEQFMYFCEQVTEAVDECEPFVYAAETDMIYLVNLPDGTSSISLSAHDAYWQTDNTLVVADFTSTDPTQPWQ